MKTTQQNVSRSALNSTAGWLKALLVSVCMLATTQTSLYAQASKEEIKTASKAVNVAEEALEDLTSQIKKAEKAIAKLDKELSEKTVKLGKLTKKRLSAEKAEADSLKKQADKLESAIATLQGKRNELATKLADLQKKKPAVESSFTAAKEQLAKLKAVPAQLKAQPVPAVKETPVVTGSWTPAAKAEVKPVLKGGQAITVPDPKKEEKSAEAPRTIQFDLPMVSGDKEIVEKLKVWKDWAERITFNPVTAEDIKKFHGDLVKALQEQGYVFANVQIPTKVWGYGIFLAKVDCGKLGNITVKNAKNYSAKQIIRALENQEGKFNYARIHGDLFDLNVKPDLKVNTQLRPVAQGGRRAVDAELEVEDKLPIHGAIEFANNGSKESNDYRIRTTLQHLNLTKHDDSLTVDWLTGGDIGETLNAFSANYFLPINDKWTVNAYGGYNQSEYDSVLPEIDVVGKGHYLGLQLSRTIYESNYERLQLTFGWLYQKTKSHLGFAGHALNHRAVALSMPSLTLGYASKAFDRFAGRNFASISVMRNFAGKYGASSKQDYLENDGPYTEGDFTIMKLQLARLQRLFAGPDAPGKWSLFGKIDAQMADDSLPGAARDYIGGFNSVRGYEESELGGDNSIVGTLELRTPLFENFIPGLKKDEKFLEENPKFWGRHRLQFVAFTDFGFVENKKPYAGQFDNQDMLSVGMGLRLGLTNYSQMSLDYGYPIIEASSETPEAGRFHVSIQLQF